MILNRKIELDVNEVITIENILSSTPNMVQDIDIVKPKLLEWITKKLQEAFDFGYSEGRKTNE